MNAIDLVLPLVIFLLMVGCLCLVLSGTGMWEDFLEGRRKKRLDRWAQAMTDSMRSMLDNATPPPPPPEMPVVTIRRVLGNCFIVTVRRDGLCNHLYYTIDVGGSVDVKT